MKPTWNAGSVPGCPYIYFTVREDGGVFRALNTAERQLIEHAPIDGSVQIANPSDYTVAGQTWTIRLIKRSIYSKTEKKEAIVEFNISWRYICNYDVLTVTQGFEDVTYSIGKSGLLTAQPTIAQSEAGCSLASELLIVDISGVSRPLTAAESAYVAFDPASNTVSIDDPNNYSLHGDVWSLIFVTTSIDSLETGGIAEIQFSVSWRDPCYDGRLVAPTF